MRINRVVLENYGLYSGRHEFDLVPRLKGKEQRPIILVGGMNGAGKTTLLDGVRLALYGRSSVGDCPSEKRYQQHLCSQVHRSPSTLIQFDYARVGVEFDFASRGTRDTYYVQRSWTLRNGSGADESLQVHKRDATSTDGDYNSWPTLPDLEPEHWQAFIDEVVPERLSQLFFFDGEKIKRIADDVTGDSAIAEAIRSLLGLDTVQRLKADLGILANREARRHMSDGEATSLGAVETEIEAMRKTLTDLEQERASVETSITATESDAKRLESQLQELGGAFVADRPVKQARQVTLEAEIQGLQRQIRQECEGIYPFSLCPSAALWLEDALRDETRSRRTTVLQEEISTLQSNIIRGFERSKILKQAALRGEAAKIVRNVVAHRMGVLSTSKTSTQLGLSETEAARVLEWLRSSREHAAQQMRRLCRRLESCERELQIIRRQLEKAPDRTALAPAFSDLTSNRELLGQRRAELKMVLEKIATLKNALAAKERDRDRLFERGREASRVRERLRTVDSVQRALDRYLARLTELKVQALRRTVTECFNHLSRKADLLHDIDINPKTFEVQLQDRDRRTLPREQLSAGEKQILAIAILWGLARTSGRPLPVIIDTPLGRLDSDHRMNLVRNYFPHAGHQVVLLSTDTEVDKHLFLELKPHVSHCFHLVYDKQDRRTCARQEYFWGDETHV
jgi:DNA sulfur modification protein DndD